MRYVSIDDPAFGAIPNSNAPGVAATNAAAFALAFAAAPEVCVPDGQTYYCQEILPPASARRLYGRGSLIAGGTIAGGQALVFVAGNAGGFTAEGLSLYVDPAIYPTVSGILLTSCSKSVAKDLNISGCEFGILVSGGDNNRVINNSIVDHGTFGIYIIDASSPVVEGNSLSGARTSSSHTIAVKSSIFFRVQNNIITQSKSGGIWTSLCVYGSISGNTVYNSTIEGIHTDSSSNINIGGNTLIWSGSSTDCGISVSSDNGPPSTNVNVTGNIINSPATAGIYLAGAQHCLVNGNLVYNPNQSGLTYSLGSGITLDGNAAGTSQNAVTGNFLMSSDSKMRYGVSEGSGGYTASDTYVGNNFYKNPAISETLLVGMGSVAGVTRSLGLRNSAGTGVTTLTIKGGIITGVV